MNLFEFITYHYRKDGNVFLQVRMLDLSHFENIITRK
jgi:hypothetical protein